MQSTCSAQRSASSLSCRQFERVFRDQIGIGPKLFQRIVRFAAVLQAKTDQPDRNGVPEHIHHANDELYYILEGRYRFKVGGVTDEASAGSFVFIPRGTPHAWSNIGATPGRVAVAFTPGGKSEYFRELEPLMPELMVWAGIVPGFRDGFRPDADDARD